MDFLQCVASGLVFESCSVLFSVPPYTEFVKLPYTSEEVFSAPFTYETLCPGVFLVKPGLIDGIYILLRE
jgi:hypothetical protein